MAHRAQRLGARHLGQGALGKGALGMQRVRSPFRWDNRFLRQFPGDVGGAPHAARQVKDALWAGAEPTVKSPLQAFAVAELLPGVFVPSRFSSSEPWLLHAESAAASPSGMSRRHRSVAC